MEISDLTQHSRRVRALVTRDELARMIAQGVADAAEVKLDSTGTTVQMIELKLGQPGNIAAEVIINVDLANGPVLDGYIHDPLAGVKL